jgi:hypothetical protein
MMGVAVVLASAVLPIRILGPSAKSVGMSMSFFPMRESAVTALNIVSDFVKTCHFHLILIAQLVSDNGTSQVAGEAIAKPANPRTHTQRKGGESSPDHEPNPLVSITVLAINRCSTLANPLTCISEGAC